MPCRPAPPRAGARPAPVAAVLLLALAAAVLPALLAGCARLDTGEPRAGGTLVLALADSLDLDPRTSHGDLAAPFLALLHEGLVRFDSTGRVVAAHAAAWKVSGDGRTYTFALRPDWRYEDGTPVAAADYVRALEALFAADPVSPARPRFWSLDGAVSRRRRDRGPLGVSAPDPRTLVVRLWAPDDALLEKLAQPRYAVPLAAPGREASSGHALATGAYRLARRGRGELVLVRNGRYRGATPGHLDTIRVRTGIAARRAALGLTSGAVGMLWPVPVEFRLRLSRDPRLGYAQSGGPGELHWLLVLNCELAPTARQQARQAVARAVNRQRVVGLLMPLASPWRGYAPGGPPSSAAPGFDPLASQSALDAAGYPRGIELAVQVPRGSVEAAAARGLVSDLGRAGVYGEIRLRARAEFEAARLARRGAVASFWSWRAPTSDPLSNLAELLLNRSLDERWGGNLGFFRSSGRAAFDSLLLGGLRERGPQERAAALGEAETRLGEEMPFVPVARVREEVYFRSPLRGVRFHPRYGLDLAHVWLVP